MADRIAGIVKWFDRDKGYGFIKCDNGNDIFVYHINIRTEHWLNKGDRVEFEVIQGNGGLQADDVVVLD